MQPAVSILIATRNRAQILRRTLECLAGQEKLAGVEWEVLVVDNGSGDDTQAVLNSLADRLPLKSLYEPEPGKNRALNLALGVARGDLWLFTDDDVEPGPLWVFELLEAARRWPDYSIFGGPVIPLFPQGTPEWLLRLVRERPLYAAFAFAQFSPAVAEGPLPHELPYGPNFAVRARAMAGVRFNTDVGPQGTNYPMGGETDLLTRLRARGERFIYVPSAPVKHVIRREQVNRRWVFRRAFCYGRGTARSKKAPGGQGSGRERAALRELLLRLPKALALFALSAIRGPSLFCQKGAAFYFLRGQIYEHRLSDSEPHGKRSEPRS